MVHSAEVRWFLPGDAPTGLLQWFKGGRLLEAEPKRTDEYLVFPDCDTVGVKLREGKFEIKAMIASPRPLSLDLGISGRTDQWVKWSFDSSGLLAVTQELHQSGRWLLVDKVRYLRKWSADSTTIGEVSPNERPDKGCNVELTSMEIHPEPAAWYSIGFEAFGPPAAIAKILDEALRLFFTAQGSVPGGVLLTGRQSMSYPAWLATFA